MTANVTMVNPNSTYLTFEKANKVQPCNCASAFHTNIKGVQNLFAQIKAYSFLVTFSYTHSNLKYRDKCNT